MELTIGSDQVPTIIITIVIVLQCYLSAYYVTMLYRRKAFSAESVKQMMSKIRNNPEGESIGVYGYPDFGNGPLSEQLPYKDWWNLNMAVRVQLNFFEYVAPAVFSLLVLGMLSPRVAFLSGVQYILSRENYRKAYRDSIGIEKMAFVSHGIIGFNILYSIFLLMF